MCIWLWLSAQQLKCKAAILHRRIFTQRGGVDISHAPIWRAVSTSLSELLLRRWFVSSSKVRVDLTRDIDDRLKKELGPRIKNRDQSPLSWQAATLCLNWYAF